jgi:hypothetical protein
MARRQQIEDTFYSFSHPVIIDYVYTSVEHQITCTTQEAAFIPDHQ